MRGARVKWLRCEVKPSMADNYSLKELKDWWKRGHLKWQFGIGKHPAPNRYLG